MEESYQQYVKCRDNYIKKMRAAEQVKKEVAPAKETRRGKQTTQELVHHRVKQMQAKYHDIFKQLQPAPTFSTTCKRNITPSKGVVSPKNWTM